jgi:hypothetical protein
MVTTPERDMIEMYIELQVKYRLFLSGFNEAWIFWTGFRRKIKYQIA